MQQQSDPRLVNVRIRRTVMLQPYQPLVIEADYEVNQISFDLDLHQTIAKIYPQLDQECERLLSEYKAKKQPKTNDKKTTDVKQTQEDDREIDIIKF
ncbi:hypothetical protein [Spirulina sp. 06S082]|uniref:hypothetical protein n=1 Tax=Spirulina sp. 06S082 TaxID=3110248 RepID=UPI002B214C25|nr:hypothetical protein [Spirulina sp. 06S082]MEA5472146.1 hypothetical protein [Spirulina sp. 06S082]